MMSKLIFYFLKIRIKKIYNILKNILIKIIFKNTNKKLSFLKLKETSVNL